MAEDYHPGLLSPLWRVPAAMVRSNIHVAESVAEAGVRGLRSAVSPLRTAGSTSRLPDDAVGARPAPDELTTSLRTRMAGLLARALQDTPGTARAELFHRLIDHLTPDEARILGALADGQAVPVVHVFAWSRAGLAGNATLKNASLIGKLANVNLPHLTPLYVNRLRALGLVEIGPEIPHLKDDYQVLMADAGVMRAVKKASRTPLTARTERHSLRLSQLGHELWTACFGEVDGPGDTAAEEAPEPPAD
jgi:hypothetical protein